MIRETEFRKKALATWQNENEKTKEELVGWLIKNRIVGQRLWHKLSNELSLKTHIKKLNQ